MSRLAALIDQAADGTRPLADVLRQVKILASRIGDSELASWATRELNGYGPDDELPDYRASRKLPVLGEWSGPFGSSISNAPVSSVGLPDEFLAAGFSARFPHSVAELEAVSGGDVDARISWDPWIVANYNRAVQNRKGGAGFEMMSLVDARIVLPRNVVAGILDSIRTRVLDLSLDLERVAPEAGEPGGPTIEDPQVDAVVQNFHITVNGDGANIATGDNARQRSSVKKGDVHSLVEAARGLGLSIEDAESFRAAVEADGDAVAESTRGFADRVRSGGVALIGNTSGSLAATGLIQIAAQFFGG